MKVQLGIIAFTLLTYTVSAQLSPIKETTQKVHIVVNDDQVDARDITRELAIGNNKPPRNASFSIDFTQIIRTNFREPNIPVSITNDIIKLSGDINYKGFDVHDVLYPASFSCVGRLSSKSGGTRDFPMTSPVVSNKSENMSFNYADTNRIFQNLNIVNQKVKYNDAVIKYFKERIRLINDYYASAASLDNTFALLQSINMNDAENWKVIKQKIDNAESQILTVDNKHYYQSLSLQENDPAKLKHKLTECKNFAADSRSRFNYMMANLHVLFYDRGNSFMMKNNPAKAEQYYRWSLEVNPLFAPSLLQLAIIDYQRNELRETICKADDILYNLHPDPETKERTYDLIRDVYDAHIDKANYQLQQRKDYYKAVDEFEEARRICEKYNTVRCDEALFNGIKAAKTGIYRDHLEKSRLYVQSGDLVKADKAVDNAIQYQLANSREITDNSEALAIRKGINQKLYDNKITIAKNFTEQKQYDDALKAFDDADQLKYQYELTASADIKDRKLAAARPRISELFYEGESFVKLNDLKSASDRLKSATALQTKYDLTGDKDINKHKELLRKSIYTQECINTEEQIAGLAKEGDAQKDKSNYLEASSNYTQAIALAKEFKDCAIDIAAIEASELEIRPAATYLTFMRDVKLKMENGDYRECLDIYSKATKYYTEKNIADFGIDHEPDQYRYIRDKGSNGLIYYAADLYREQNELDKALLLSKLLLSRNYDVKFLEGSLYTLGYKLGEREKLQNPKGKWKNFVKQYSGGDKKLRRLEKGFSKGYRK